MADVSTADPADQDPISQTFTAGNALNAKTFIDYQFQMGNQSFQDSQRSVRNLDEHLSELRTYRIKSMERADILYAQSMGMVTAINTAAASALLGGAGITSVAEGQQSIKGAQTTPPTYQDPSTAIAALAAQVSALTQFVQGLSIAPTAAAAK